METNHLYYKIHKGKVTVQDYIDWSHGLLCKNISSSSLNILSSCSPHDNIFEVQSYFNREVRELAFKQPAFEEAARAYIDFLATEILKADNYRQIYRLTDRVLILVSGPHYFTVIKRWGTDTYFLKGFAMNRRCFE